MAELKSGVLNDHIVICNWNDMGEEIIHQLHAEVVGDPRAIVIITEHPEKVPMQEPSGASDPFHNVFVIPGDPTRDRILARASIELANTAIVLSDPEEGEHADTKSILIALAIEAIEPKVHTVVELLHSRSRMHFRHTQVDEVVCVDELAEKLLAQAALTHGLTEFYLRLLTATRDTNEVYVIDVPEGFVGRSFRDLERALIDYDDEECILVGVQVREEASERSRQSFSSRRQRSRLTINPPTRRLQSGSLLKGRDYLFQTGDRIYVIAYCKPGLQGLSLPD